MSGHHKWSEITHKSDGPWAWVFDGQTGRVHKWYDEHPERDHRRRAEQVLGRPARSSEGDVLGVAKLIHGMIKLEAYYGLVVPKEVKELFSSDHPGAEVRQARAAEPAHSARPWSDPQPAPPSAAEWAQEHLAQPLTLGQKLKKALWK